MPSHLLSKIKRTWSLISRSFTHGRSYHFYLSCQIEVKALLSQGTVRFPATFTVHVGSLEEAGAAIVAGDGER